MKVCVMKDVVDGYRNDRLVFSSDDNAQYVMASKSIPANAYLSVFKDQLKARSRGDKLKCL